MIVKVDVEDLRLDLVEERVVRIALLQPADEGERLLGLVLVPEVEHVDLELRFAAQLSHVHAFDPQQPVDQPAHRRAGT